MSEQFIFPIAVERFGAASNLLEIRATGVPASGDINKRAPTLA